MNIPTDAFRRNLSHYLKRVEAGESFTIVDAPPRGSKREARVRAVVSPVPPDEPIRTLADEMRDATADFALASQLSAAQRGTVTGRKP